MIKNQYFPYWFYTVLCLVGIFVVSVSVFALTPRVLIVGDGITKNRTVTLRITPPTNARQMRISHVDGFDGILWKSVRKSKRWKLTAGSGTKEVYVQFRDKRRVLISAVKDDVELKVPKVLEVDMTINDEDEVTDSRYVSLDLIFADGVEEIRINNTRDFDDVEPLTTLQHDVRWILTAESGKKKVYVEFIDGNDKKKVISERITYIQPDRFIPEGSLIKGQRGQLYYFGFDGRLHPFLRSSVYHSWYTDFSNVHVVSNAKLQEYQIGQPVGIRPGTWLIKFSSSPHIYSVEPGNYIRPILSEVEAMLLFGEDWARRILVLSDPERQFYTIRHVKGEDDDGVVDTDGDGIEKEDEETWGSSDTDSDSDNDGLSDYEEIVYWFSDPIISDTDEDGVSDGEEVLAFTSPVGSGTFTELPSFTYRYPQGSVVRYPGEEIFSYHRFNGRRYSLGDSLSDKGFITNNIFSRFISTPSIPVPVSSVRSRIRRVAEDVLYPTILLNGVVTPL